MLLDNFDLYNSQRKIKATWDLSMSKSGYIIFSKQCAQKIDFKKYSYLSFFINRNDFKELGVRFYATKQGRKIYGDLSAKSRASDLLKDFPALLGRFVLKRHQFGENCLDCIFEKEAKNGK